MIVKEPGLVGVPSNMKGKLPESAGKASVAGWASNSVPSVNNV